MKRYLIAVLVVVSVIVFMGTGNNTSFQVSESMSTPPVKVTYANSQVDTVYYKRPPDLVAASFSARWNDSVSVTNVIVRRIYQGLLLPVQTGDTLISSYAKAGSGDSATVTNAALTILPLCDAYRFVVTYAGSANGVTAPNAGYSIQQQFYNR